MSAPSIKPPAKVKPRNNFYELEGVNTPRAERMPAALVAHWDDRIRRDYGNVRRHHAQWRANKDLVENKVGRFGNLASDFVGMLHMRVLQEELGIRIRPDNTRDPKAVRNAENAEVIAQAVSRITDLRLQLRDATVHASWAPFGVLKVGHPADQYALEFMQSFRTTNIMIPDVAALVDDFEEVDQSFVSSLGASVADIQPMSDQQRASIRVDKIDPAPILNPHLGYPWVKALDPRMIVIPENAQNETELPYITELHFITLEELKVLYRGLDLPDNICNGSTYSDLFKETQTDGDITQFPHMLLVAFTYIIRDRNNPKWNNRILAHVLGRPEDGVIIDAPNPYDGMNRYIFLRPDVTRSMFARTLAEELAAYTEIHHDLIRAISRDTQDLAQRAWLIGAGAGLESEDKQNLKNPNFDGLVDCADANQISRLNRDAKIEDNTIRALMFFRSLVQTRSRQSDLDLGTAVRNITANQVNALVDATGYNVRAFINEIGRAARESIVKLMEMVARFSDIIGKQEYHYEGRLAVLDRGSHDFKTSMFYDIRVIDSAEELDAEQRITWVQFVKTVTSIDELKMQYDMRAIAAKTNEKFGEDRESLLVRLAGPEGQPPGVPPPVNALPGGIVGPPGIFPGQSGPPMVGSPQHPERSPGDQGVPDVGNLVRGQMMTGMGLGDEAT